VSLRFDLAGLSATDRYKLLGGLVVPRPIALVTSHSPDGRVNAAPGRKIPARAGQRRRT